MPTLAAGASVTLTLTDYDSVVVNSDGGVISVEAVSGLGVSAGKLAEFSGQRTFGPYSAGNIKLTAAVKPCYYEVSAAERPSAVSRIVVPSAHNPMLRIVAMAERGSAGTYHTTVQVADDVAFIQPIIGVTRDPADPTYTSDDVYDYIGAAPTSAMLDVNGQPNPTGGASAWNFVANATFARQAGASAASPVPVVGPLIPVTTIPRTDGGAGRLIMLRTYSAGSSHASAATTRMPTYAVKPSDQALWDSAYPLLGMHKFYFKSGNFVSTNQDSFSTVGSPATRWANTNIIGVKCYYSRPAVSVLVAGDSISSGASSQSGEPSYHCYTARAGELLQAQGYACDVSNVGVSGYAWEEFAPIARQWITTLKPSVVVLPTYTPNGVNAAHTSGAGNTVADAMLHLEQFLMLRDYAMAAGAKVIAVTPHPRGAQGAAANAVTRNFLREWVMKSGMPYIDAFTLANADYSYQAQYTIGDNVHPNALANQVLAASLAPTLLQVADL